MFDAAQGYFFANLEALPVGDSNDAKAIQKALELQRAGLADKLPAQADGDNFMVLRDVLDTSTDMLPNVASRHCARGMRFDKRRPAHQAGRCTAGMA